MHHHSLEAKRASKTNFVCVQIDISTLFCLVLYIVLHTRKTSIVTTCVNMSRSSFAKTSATFHRNHRASSSSSSSGKLSARTRLHPNHRRGNRKQRANNFAANKNATALTTRAGPGNSKNQKFALLFDCDGVLVETEELHRLAYNKSFEHFGLQIETGTQMEWVPSYYDVLANTVGGGKPKMRWHFKENKWPTVTKSDKYGKGEVLETSIQDQLIDDLQDKKTEFYKKIVEEVAQARDGILELMDEAIARPDVAVGICSAATKAGFEKVVNSVVGKERLDKLDVLMAGDDVTKKKPDPLIYNLAREKVDLPAEMCVVIEDSIVGLRAAEGAGMPCIITPCGSTLGQDFKGEGAKFVCATTVKASGVTLSKIFPDGSDAPNFDF